MQKFTCHLVGAYVVFCFPSDPNIPEGPEYEKISTLSLPYNSTHNYHGHIINWDRYSNELTGRMDGRLDGWLGGWMAGWLGRMDGWLAGWMGIPIFYIYRTWIG